MKPTAGLSETCLAYIGLRLEVRLDVATAWTTLADSIRDTREYLGAASLNGRFAELMPKRFYRHAGVLRAFKALVLLPGHALNGKDVLVYPRSDGFDWDFSIKICPEWGLLFGRGEPQFPAKNSPERWPSIYSAGIVVGHGAALSRKLPKTPVGAHAPQAPAAATTAD